ncbi:MAG: IS256 family transposase, partial [bacterium]|nr:IS256 family transposase [bacterium]
VHDRRDDHRFSSQILPPYMRKSPKVAEVLPILYLRGLSTGDFREALPALLGEKASGLSPASITRLTAEWQADYDAFRKRDLSAQEFIYVWVDGVHFRVRLEEDRLCTLVVLGVRRDGTKELLAVDDGYRESSESWSSVLRDLSARGLRMPLLAIGDGALGFWKAVRDVWPETKEQRCWVHRLANVLDKLPKRIQGKAKQLLSEIMNAETREVAVEAMDVFDKEYGAKYPKAVASLRRDEDKLLTFYEFPAEHWQHIRSANAIESSFATVRLRTRVTKGAGSRTKALLMAFKLLVMAEKRWRKINAPQLAEKVADGALFVDGIIQNDDDEKERKDAA